MKILAFISLFLTLTLSFVPLKAATCELLFDQSMVLDAANPVPENGVYARVVPLRVADAIRAGQAPLSRHEEAFITAYDDIEDVTDLAERLSMFVDAEGVRPVDISRFVILKFRFIEPSPRTIRSPIDPNGERGFGFLPGGHTSGGAREWVIDSDVNMRGEIEFLE